LLEGSPKDLFCQCVRRCLPLIVALIGVAVGEFIGAESGGGLGYLIIQFLDTLNAADIMGGWLPSASSAS